MSPRSARPLRCLPVLLACAAFTVSPRPVRAATEPCPSAGAAVRVMLQPPPDGTVIDALVVGILVEATCDGTALGHYPVYAAQQRCGVATPDGCRIDRAGLAPGEWVHRVVVSGTGQLQGRRGLLLDGSAGTHIQRWQLYANVATVSSLADGEGCLGCLRAAIEQAEAGAKPALVQFAPPLAGTIRLASALPPLAGGAVTIDGFDADGTPRTRTIDGNGLNRAGLALRSAGNAVLGVRVINVGGNSDSVVVDGPGADANRLEQLEIVGRSLQICGANSDGCVIDGVCRTPLSDPPFGVCGDDGIAVRNGAGMGAPVVVRDCEISGAHDKGIKASESGVVHVEGCHVHDNRDGGLQATFSGALTAYGNVVERNRGTNSANGLAANGSLEGTQVAARLKTKGNLVLRNSLRGISIRGLSVAELADDFSCGNGSVDRGRGFGVTIFDGGMQAPLAILSGLGLVYNAAGGVFIEGTGRADLGGLVSRGGNALAFNGASAGPPSPVNLQNFGPTEVTAAYNQWEHCGPNWTCDEARIQAADVLVGPDAGAIITNPAQAHHRRQPPLIERIEPSFARAGEIVRIYGTGFDAIDGTGPGGACELLGPLNTCTPLRGNCVLFDRSPGEVVAVTPTMIAVRVPSTCVSPVPVRVRTRYSRGTGEAQFCSLGSTNG